MVHRKNISFVLLLSMLLLIQLSPAVPRAWMLIDMELQPTTPVFTFPIEKIQSADLNQDDVLETFTLIDNHVQLISDGYVVWQSPPEWEVVQAAFTDLNTDGKTELTLLLWRTFKPWPVDRWLPHGGRIAGFQDHHGRSCHIIMIGWQRDSYRELWAGSALSSPIIFFLASDLDKDGEQELIVLEGDYDMQGSRGAHTLKIWHWNGFGFSATTSCNGVFNALALAVDENDHPLVLTP